MQAAPPRVMHWPPQKKCFSEIDSPCTLCGGYSRQRFFSASIKKMREESESTRREELLLNDDELISNSTKRYWLPSIRFYGSIVLHSMLPFWTRSENVYSDRIK